MKSFTYVLSIIAALLVIFNFTRINFNDPFHNESIVAVITVIAGLCVVIILAILRISKKIENIQKRKS